MDGFWQTEEGRELRDLVTYLPVTPTSVMLSVFRFGNGRVCAGNGGDKGDDLLFVRFVMIATCVGGLDWEG